MLTSNLKGVRLSPSVPSHRGTSLNFLLPQGLSTDGAVLRPFVHLTSALLRWNASSKRNSAALQPWPVKLETQPGSLTLSPPVMLPACRYVSRKYTVLA